MAKKPEGKIVSAVGLSVNSDGNPDLAKRIEAAMADAILKAYADGVGQDTEEVKRRMQAAREAVLSD